MAIASLTIDLNARLANIERDMGRAAQVAERQSQRMQASFAKAGQAFAAIGTAVGAGTFGAFIKSSIDAADNLNDLSQKIGVSVETLAGYKLAAEQSGTSLEGMGNAAKKLNQAIATNNPLLQKLGITAKDANGAMVQLADVFASIPDGAQKTAIAMQLMGKSGADMIPLLNGGSDALQKMLEDGKKLYPLTREMALAADQFNDELAKLKVAAEGAGVALGGPLAKAMNDSIEIARTTGKEYGNLIGILAGFGKLLAAPFESTNSEKAIALQEKRFSLMQRIEAIKASGASDDVKNAGIASLQGQLKDLGSELDTLFKKDKLNLLSKSDLKAAAKKTIDDNERAKKMRGLFDSGDKAKAGKLDEIDPFGAQRRAAEAAELSAQIAAQNEAFDALAESRDYQIAQDEKAAGELGRLRAEYIAILDPIQQYRDKLAEVDKLAASGLLNAEQATAARLYWQEQIDAAAGFGEAMKQTASEMDLFWQEAAKSMQSSLSDFLFDPFENGVDGMLQNFGNLLKRMAADAIAADISRAIFGNASSAGGGGQNILGSVAELFGFANGGSFTVGGGGGTDSQVVAFRATPGEQVSIRTPAQQRAVAGGNTTINFQISTPDAESFRRSAGQIQADLARAVQSARRYA